MTDEYCSENRTVIINTRTNNEFTDKVFHFKPRLSRLIILLLFGAFLRFQVA